MQSATGIIGNILISPHMLPAHLTEQSYLLFLEEELPLLLKDVLLASIPFDKIIHVWNVN